MAITNDELLQDLKQFINAKIDGVESRLDAKIDGVESRLDTMEEELQDIKVMQNEILDVVGKDIQEVKTVQHKHDIRITKLEAKAA